LDLLLQIWAGLFYLFNKIFLAVGESKQQKYWRIIGWICYLVGLPAWVIIFVIKHNWIAASLEAGGAPAMLFGLVSAWHGHSSSSVKFERIAKYSIYGFVAFGTLYSFYDYGGLRTLVQLLEIFIVIGYLFGTYYIARRQWTGWLWFMLMNISCGYLMFIQQKYLLAYQQYISLLFVGYGLWHAYIRNKKSAS